jgi:hypothetical protein
MGDTYRLPHIVTSVRRCRLRTGSRGSLRKPTQTTTTMIQHYSNVTPFYYNNGANLACHYSGHES